MVGIVIVSHSLRLAEGVVELAREMGGPELALEAAGGLDDGSTGTDAMRVLAAIDRARSSDGVLVLMDLGSALMSAEMAMELADPDGGPIVLSAAPLIEGAVAAAVSARGGATLEAVALEARGGLRGKASQLGEGDEPPAAGGPAPSSPEPASSSPEPASSSPEPTSSSPAAGADALELRLTVSPAAGLHARPAARFVALWDEVAEVSVSNLTRGTGPVDGRSHTMVQTLGARQGDEILVRASGAGAAAALEALEALAAENFGDTPAPAPSPAPAATSSPAPAAGSSPAVSSPAALGASSPSATRSHDAPPQPARALPGPPPPGTRLAGVPASSGIAIGPARHLQAARVEVAAEPSGPPEEELGRLEAARVASRADLEAAQESVAARAGAAEAAIFAAHLALLDDPALVDPARRGVQAGESAGSAWQAAADAVATAFRNAADAPLRERAVDVEDVAARVLAHLAGAGADPADPMSGDAPLAGDDAGAAPADLISGAAAAADLVGSGILVADELTPGAAAGLNRDTVQGIATARGGATAHAAILARALGIPAVVGLGDAILAVAEGTPLALDGDAGHVDVAPDPALLADRERARAAREAAAAAALAQAHEPGATRDGHRVEVFANLGSAAEVESAIAHGAEGVGLLRTEFLFLDRPHPPDEDEQVAVLSEIAAALDGRPLVVRTLDAGADKPLPFLRQAAEDNPFLGVRGIRLSLAEPALLDAQLRAVLRVAVEHPLAVMFPMVSTVEELLAARARLDGARRALDLDPPLEVGVMVEVPALALAADRVAPHVDFLSIGTNDLAQYTMAAERGNGALAGLLEGPLPPVLALIERVCAAAQAHGGWVGVCGELAGDPDAAVLLAGLGVRELSMAAGRIPAVKAALRSVDLAAAQEAAHEAVGTGSAADARGLAAALMRGGDEGAPAGAVAEAARAQTAGAGDEPGSSGERR